LTNATQDVDKRVRDRPASFVQLQHDQFGDASAYRPLVDDFIEILADIMVSYPGPGTREFLAKMIARYITTTYSKKLPDP
jgi:hypothetical protein